MKNTKSKIGTIIVIIFTLILAGVAIFTAVRLYQLRNQAVAPNVPSSKPKAQEVATNCTLAFTLAEQSMSTPTATPTGTPTPTATPTGSATPRTTPTGTPGTPNSCNGTCGSNLNCQSNLICYQGFCRNPSCTSSTSCGCGSSTSTPVATTTSTPSLPNSGTSWPTLVGAGLGIFVIIGSMILAL